MNYRVRLKKVVCSVEECEVFVKAKTVNEAINESIQTSEYSVNWMILPNSTKIINTSVFEIHNIK